MSQKNVDVVRRSLDGWNRGDPDAWLKGVHPDIEWFSAVSRQVEGSETVRRGPAEMREFWDEWHAVWDLVVDVTEVRDLGDTILAMGRMQTRGKASGVQLDTSVAYVFEFDHGLVRRVRAYLDQTEALTALGLSE